MSGGSEGVTDKESEVSREMQSLVEVTEVSWKALGDLESRLSPILRPSTECNEEEKPEEVLVSFAENIRKIRKKVNGLSVKIVGIQSRVEL